MLDAAKCNRAKEKNYNILVDYAVYPCEGADIKYIVSILNVLLEDFLKSKPDKIAKIQERAREYMNMEDKDVQKKNVELAMETTKYNKPQCKLETAIIDDNGYLAVQYTNTVNGKVLTLRENVGENKTFQGLYQELLSNLEAHRYNEGGVKKYSYGKRKLTLMIELLAQTESVKRELNNTNLTTNS